MVTKNDTGVEIYPKSIEHGFEAPVYMAGPERIAPGLGQLCPNE